MKNRITLFFASLSLTVFLGISLMAQEKTEVTVQLKKNGKVLKDTTYHFEDEAEAKHAMQMMELLSGEEKHSGHYNYTMAHSGKGQSKAMVFISEDGNHTEVKHFNGDSLVWVSNDDHPQGEHVVIVKSSDGETFDVLMDEDEDGKKVLKKELKVIVSGDELHEAHEDVFISEDDIDVEIEKIIKEHGDGENVKVIVIKKGGDRDEHNDEVNKQ
jgi:hypothetical protein